MVDMDSVNATGDTSGVNSSKLKEKLSSWKANAHTKKNELMNSLSDELSALIDVFGESDDNDPDSFATNSLGSLANEYPSTPTLKSKARSDLSLRMKEFRMRNSVLTDLLNSNHIRSVYNIFVAILVIICLNTSVSDIVETGSLIHFYHFEHILWAFGQISEVITTWLCMLIVALMIYPIFSHWASFRIPVRRVTSIDVCFLVGYGIYLFCFLVFPARYLVKTQLPPASSLIVVMEQIRMTMKVHAFVRENIPKVLSRKDKAEEESETVTGSIDLNFSRYLYFFFAPTLVYRDEYPRTQSIRWQYVVSNFAQVIACIAYMYYMFARFCFPQFRNFDSHHVTAQNLVVSTFKCMLPAAVLLFIGFFGVLHSWLNAFAEMLKFGDRHFYRDWWNSRNFGQFYRTWNIVVHDWLYSYIYSDVFRVCGRQYRRAMAMSSVFVISAIVHEYVLIVSFRFFYPVLFVMFLGAGFAFIFVRGTHRVWNVFLWVALFSGTGILMCLYSMEWYAQKNCRAILPHSSFDFLLPRSWFCILR